jgi:hypothetical protein|tara:strand:- start:1090 stop:1734 length:645 start_codon:yes stop_codon:yes gene_type:complete
VGPENRNTVNERLEDNMKTLKLIIMLGLGSLVSACATVDTASRNAHFEPQQPEYASTLPSVRVGEINVLVPQSLKVSERNSYYPGGDIVWRSDAIGNRHQQVKAIFDTALAQGTAPMDGLLPIRLDIRVERFHALTEKARYTTGGVHSVTFAMQIRDLATGAAIGKARLVKADLDGFGGRQALRAEARGLTQKIRITNHLAEVIRQELASQDGF